MRMILGTAAAVLGLSTTAILADTFVMMPFPDNPKAKGVYHCNMRDGVAAGENGQFVRNRDVGWFLQKYRDFEFRADSGEFRGGGQVLEWVVLRPGDSKWDLIAHLPGVDSSFNMMRIEIWNDPIGFVMTNGKEYYAGICTTEE